MAIVCLSVPQDTVVALQALATWAALTSSHDIDLTVRVETEEFAAVAGFHVNQENALLHQSQQVRSSANLADQSRSSENELLPHSDRRGGGAGPPGDCRGEGSGSFSGRMEGISIFQLCLLVVNIHTVPCVSSLWQQDF